MGYYSAIKRVADFLLSFFLLVLFSPLLLLIAILVKLKLGSPVLFRQSRPGFHGKIFQIFKFRTMKDATDANGMQLSDELRLTPFGKALRSTSLDELPELFNVLKGEMSLVGPRPLLTEYLSRYTPEQAKRHNVRPGITGWAQVNGRNAISWDQVFDYDIFYVENCSPMLDLKILFHTIGKVIKRADISESGQATRTAFHGSPLKK